MSSTAVDETYTKADRHLDLSCESGRILGQIEALEAEKAQLGSALLDAYAALHSVEAQATAAASFHVSTDRIVAEEIALATGVGAREVARRLGLATAPRRHRLVRQALRAGEVSLHRALQDDVRDQPAAGRGRRDRRGGCSRPVMTVSASRNAPS